MVSGDIGPYVLTGFHLDEVATKRAILANASHRYALADSSKFRLTAAHRVCDLSGFDTLLTDQTCPQALQAGISRAQGAVIVA